MTEIYLAYEMTGIGSSQRATGKVWIAEKLGDTRYAIVAWPDSINRALCRYDNVREQIKELNLFPKNWIVV